MNTYLLAFQSPLLAQQKLSENLPSKEQHGVDYDIIKENPRVDIMTNINTVPSFNKAIPALESSNTELKSISSRTYRRAYEKYLNSDSGRETLSKAVKYNIPFDSQDIDFLNLIYKIAEYECLLEKKTELGNQPNEINYDTVKLQEESDEVRDDPERPVIDDNHQHRRDYYASIAL